MACTQYTLYANGSGVLSASFRICGDNTPTTIYVTGLTANQAYPTKYSIVNGTLSTAYGSVTATGVTSQGYAYDYVLAPWAGYSLQSSVSALSAHGV